MKFKNYLFISLFSACLFLSGIVNTQALNEEKVLDAIGEVVSTIRYPSISRTGDYILAWPQDIVGYVDYDFSKDSVVYKTSARLEELQEDGSWEPVFLQGENAVQAKPNVVVIKGKTPGKYRYRLWREVEEEKTTSTDEGDDDSSDFYGYYEPAIEVLVVGPQSTVVDY